MNIEVDHPHHYNQSAHPETRHILRLLDIDTECFEWECIEVINRYQLDGYYRFGQFQMFNAVKYLWRYKCPEDLQKARWYIKDYIRVYSMRYFYITFMWLPIQLGIVRDDFQQAYKALIHLNALIDIKEKMARDSTDHQSKIIEWRN